MDYDVEILRMHYAETLRHWHERFQARRSEAKGIYDERFCGMWEFYLATSEAMFRNGALMVFQIQLAHRRDAAPLTRDYISSYRAPSTETIALAPGAIKLAGPSPTIRSSQQNRMHDMGHSVHEQPNGFAWRPWLAFFAFASIAGYFLFSEHRVHVLAILPWALILLACPLLHLFMHGRHDGHGGHANREGDGVASERNRDSAPPAGEPRPHRH